MSVLFALLGKDPLTALGVYFLDPLTDSYSLQEIAVKATPLVMIAIGLVALLPRQCLEHRRRRPVPDRRGRRQLARGEDPGHRRRRLGAAGDAACSARSRARSMRSFPLCKVRFGASEILTSLMLVYVADLLLDYLVRGPWRDPNGYNFPTTAEFDPVATVPILIEGSRLHLGALIALLVVAIAWTVAGTHHQGIRDPGRRRRPQGGALRGVQRR